MSELSEEEVFLYATKEWRAAYLEKLTERELATFAASYARMLRVVGKDDAALLDAVTILYTWQRSGYISPARKDAAVRIALTAQAKERGV